MGAWWTKLTRGDTREVIKGPVPRIRNIIINNFRGILGVLIPVVALTWMPKKDVHSLTVQAMWLWMFWFFLIHPIAVPCTAMIPIFILPMCGVMSTMDTTKCYFNEGVALFLLASMLILLWNNSGFDRRIALCFLTSGDACQFSGKRMVFKCSLAAYILSMFSNRLIVSSTLTQYVTPIFMNLQSSYGKSGTEPNFDEMRFIVNNAIQTSSSIGSIAILHSAYATLLFRAIWLDSAGGGMEYPDIFNYLQYSAYAFPVSFVMFLFNVSYHMLLINLFVKKGMTAGTMNELRNNVQKLQDSIPKKVTTHEKLTVFFSFLALLIFFLRWNKYQNKGWADYNVQAGAPEVPLVKDACVAAIFVFSMHVLPKSFNFLQFASVDKRSQLKDLKPESAILWWRFVDKNTNYAYFFMFGAGIAINKACRDTGLGRILADNLGKDLTTKPTWCVGLFLVCLITCILANIMTGCAGVVCFLPFVINMSVAPAPVPWQGKLYLAALGVGVGSSLGFMLPFLYTPAYFCHYTGKVPIMKMIKYSFLSVAGCCAILWFSLCYWGPYLWDPKDVGIFPAAAPVSGLTTAPPAAADTPAPDDGGGGGGDDA